MNLLDFLSERPFEPSRIAFAFQGVSLTRGELFARAHQLALALMARGARAGDRVGLLMANPAIFMTSLLGLARLGAVGGAVQPAWLSTANTGPLQRLRFSCLLHDRRETAGLTMPPHCKVLSAREAFAVDRAAMSRVAGHQPSVSCPDPAQPWLLSMSSGTTGQPKCVVTSQSACLAALQLGEQFQRDDRVVLFLEHTMYWAITNALRAMATGAAVVFQPPSILPAQLLQVVHDARATVLVLSADAASKLANYLLDFPAQSVSLRLSRVIVGGGRVSARVLEVLREQWGARVVVVYGSTEMGPMAVWRQSGPEDEGGDLPYSLTPLDGVQAQVVDGLAHPVPPLELGFLRLRSAAMFSGYLDDDGRLPQQAPDWFYPGDLASLTSDGHIELQGRADHVLNLGGNKVDPERIEQTIACHPGVADVAVTVATMGAAEVPVLVGLLVLKPGQPMEAVRAHSAQHLPAAHCPVYWLSVPVLPRNVSGKLQRKALASMVRIERNS